MIQILGSNQRPTCSPCIYYLGSACRYDKTQIISKQPDDFCADGKWMVRYKNHVMRNGKLKPMGKPKIYCCGLTNILTNRKRYELAR